MSWKQALIRAINTEVAIEKTAATVEEERREAWWNTTWALAGVPRADWSEAAAEFMKRTGQKRATADSRRLIGSRISQTACASGFPLPGLSQVAATWLGKSPTDEEVNEAIAAMAKAEADGMSWREFGVLLNGAPAHKSPENMTEDEEDAVVAKVAQQRPAVVAQQVAKPAVAAATIEDPKARTAVRQQAEQSRRRSAAGSTMPKPKTTPQPSKADQADDITELELTILITDVMVKFTDAKIAASDATAILERAGRFLSDEQRDDLTAGADTVLAAWQWFQSLLTGVTDDDLHDFINTGTES